MNQSINELKALAYDAIVNVEAWQSRLREINTKIAQLTKEEEEKATSTTPTFQS